MKILLILATVTSGCMSELVSTPNQYHTNPSVPVIGQPQQTRTVSSQEEPTYQYNKYETNSLFGPSHLSQPTSYSGEQKTFEVPNSASPFGVNSYPVKPQGSVTLPDLTPTVAHSLAVGPYSFVAQPVSFSTISATPISSDLPQFSTSIQHGSTSGAYSVPETQKEQLLRVHAVPVTSQASSFGTYSSPLVQHGSSSGAYSVPQDSTLSRFSNPDISRSSFSRAYSSSGATYGSSLGGNSLPVITADTKPYTKITNSLFSGNYSSPITDKSRAYFSSTPDLISRPSSFPGLTFSETPSSSSLAVHGSLLTDDSASPITSQAVTTNSSYSTSVASSTLVSKFGLPLTNFSKSLTNPVIIPTYSASATTQGLSSTGYSNPTQKFGTSFSSYSKPETTQDLLSHVFHKPYSTYTSSSYPKAFSTTSTPSQSPASYFTSRISTTSPKGYSSTYSTPSTPVSSFESYTKPITPKFNSVVYSTPSTPTSYTAYPTFSSTSLPSTTHSFYSKTNSPQVTPTSYSSLYTTPATYYKEHTTVLPTISQKYIELSKPMASSQISSTDLYDSLKTTHDSSSWSDNPFSSQKSFALSVDKPDTLQASLKAHSEPLSSNSFSTSSTYTATYPTVSPTHDYSQTSAVNSKPMIDQSSSFGTWHSSLSGPYSTPEQKKSFNPFRYYSSGVLDKTVYPTPVSGSILSRNSVPLSPSYLSYPIHHSANIPTNSAYLMPLSSEESISSRFVIPNTSQSSVYNVHSQLPTTYTVHRVPLTREYHSLQTPHVRSWKTIGN